MNDASWDAIFRKYNIDAHDFSASPYIITADQIKDATKHFSKTNEKEVRILCKQDAREDRPTIFKNMGIFLLPVKNGQYAIIKGEGYIDIPSITTLPITYINQLDFILETSYIGNSEMQHLDFAYATSLIRTFLNDADLVLTIRGRKYTPAFDFTVNTQHISVQSVQTEVDAGYEGKNTIVLIEAKNTITSNLIIRQLYYPFRQWSAYTSKKVITLFFEKRDDNYLFWQFDFADIYDYNSIHITRSAIYCISPAPPLEQAMQRAVKGKKA